MNITKKRKIIIATVSLLLAGACVSTFMLGCRGGRAGNLHWCGIFAVWSAQQAGVAAAKWVLSKGPGGLGKPRSDRNYLPGDSLVCKGALNHHCVLTARNGNKLETVNGNSYYQSVSLATRDASEIALYYRLSDQDYES